jgi:putative oxidoreductase
LQRLFTTFADGWPGFGLLLQRLGTGIVLLYSGVVVLHQASAAAHRAPHLAAAGLGVLLLVGFWTPIAGVLLAVVEVWIALSGGGNACMPIMLAVLGATLAMIGPGAWSVDARLFGRKEFRG